VIRRADAGERVLRAFLHIWVDAIRCICDRPPRLQVVALVDGHDAGYAEQVGNFEGRKAAQRIDHRHVESPWLGPGREFTHSALVLVDVVDGVVAGEMNLDPERFELLPQGPIRGRDDRHRHAGTARQALDHLVQPQLGSAAIEPMGHDEDVRRR
jgi:hypothetical protein